jgi:hypothetical protein
LQVLINQGGRSAIDGGKLGLIEDTNFDHRPALSDRKFDTKAWDTIPPANDPNYIEAIKVKQHDTRTNGPGGTTRITTRGSDTGERARTRKIQRGHAEHQAAMKSKNTGQPRPKPTKPKRPIRSRSTFPKGRGFQSRRSA